MRFRNPKGFAFTDFLMLVIMGALILSVAAALCRDLLVQDPPAAEPAANPSSALSF